MDNQLNNQEDINQTPISTAPENETPPNSTTLTDLGITTQKPPQNNLLKIIFIFLLTVFILVTTAFAYFNIQNNKKNSSTKKITSTGSCSKDSKTYKIGESFIATDGCNTCTCESQNNISCTENECLEAPSATNSAISSSITDTFRVLVIGSENEEIDITLTEALQRPLDIYKLTVDMCTHQSTPVELSQFTNVTSLELLGAVFYNKNSCKKSLFTEIDSSLSKLNKLESLKIDGEIFTTIPDVVFNMTSLKNLALHGSGITSISDKISNLKNLESLELKYDEQLTALPSLAQLTKLKTVVLVNTFFRNNVEEQNKLIQTYPNIKFDFFTP